MMKKTFLTCVAALVFCCLFSLSAMATELVPPFSAGIPDERLKERLVDDADLLTDAEEQELLEKLNAVSERYRFDVAVVTTNATGYSSIEAFADDY